MANQTSATAPSSGDRLATSNSLPVDQLVKVLTRHGHFVDSAQGIRDLTDRQRLVLQLMADGLTSQSIAEMLDISYETVRVHRYRILKRLGVHSTGQAVAVAIRGGIIP